MKFCVVSFLFLDVALLAYLILTTNKYDLSKAHSYFSLLLDKTASIVGRKPALLTSHGDNLKIIRPSSLEIGSLEINPDRIPTKKQLIQKLIAIKDEHIQHIGLEGDSSDANVVNLHIDTHAFISAVHRAYADHLPLVITPDIIWYLISSAFAVHINQNAELLRKQFVDFEGKKQIVVWRNDFVFNSSENYWPGVVNEFSANIGDFTRQNISHLFVGNFSTSTLESTVVSKIVLMDAMQEFFLYRLKTSCGIPEIRIKGTRQDWASIIERTRRLFMIMPMMKPWSRTLLEILHNFINVYDNQVDPWFWNQIYKTVDRSGGPFLSGWAIGLFPYLRYDKKNPFVWERTWKDAIKSAFLRERPTTNEFPLSFNKAPFEWNYHGETHAMLFLGGLLSVQYDLNDHSLTPVFGYVITEDKVKPDARKRNFGRPPQ